ncbi:MAG: hypothetical protein GX654_01600 [Desulfatiglans sp.]|jgi:hypothetical protein|nr:hypothetical protein [Desulfatiglans sp.]
MDENMEKNVKNILNTAMKVITNPVGFYREMPKTGGFVEPLIFAVVLGLVSGVITAILSIFSLGSASSFWMGLAYIILYPIMVAICSFIGAAILFLIWKIMGSLEPYETTYRCVAYATAITPLTVILGIIPYLGSILGLAWGLYLLLVASTEVHKIAQKTALMVFGIIFILLAIFTTCGQFTARRVQKSLGQYENMTPEEAGKAFGEFMKGVKEEAEKD